MYSTECLYNYTLYAGANDSYPVVSDSSCTTTPPTSATATQPIGYSDWIFVNGFIILLLALIAFRFIFYPLK